MSTCKPLICKDFCTYYLEVMIGYACIRDPLGGVGAGAALRAADDSYSTRTSSDAYRQQPFQPSLLPISASS